MVQLAKPVARVVRVSFPGERKRMVVNLLSPSFSLARIVFLFDLVEIDAGLPGPFSDHVACFLKDDAKFAPESFGSQIVSLRGLYVVSFICIDEETRC